ncbi:hypothetical protein T07_2736 [Trichinella nelsoni]|uniref:Uncharacterized protein n=1 Tax=Trichinella nelsoni TaxID=6336 RepID=A0A0V0RWB0_9BILA|nr:hypothetical protein T07_2736 [Trichinella nelsoni]
MALQLLVQCLHIRRDVLACLRKAARRDSYSTLAVYEHSERYIMLMLYFNVEVCINSGFLLMKTSAKLSEDKEAFYERAIGTTGQTTRRNEISVIKRQNPSKS